MNRYFATGGVILLLCLSAIAAAAQQPPNVTAQPNTIYVSAEGRYEAAPDTAVMQFNIAAQEDTAKAAYERAGNAAEQIRQILRNNGIDPRSAQIGFFSLAPVYDWRQPKRKLVGYRVSSSVTLKLKDFSKVAPIVQQLSDMDVTENQSLSYTLDNMDAAKLKAVQDAYERAHEEAQTVAKSGGRMLGELYYGSVDTYEQVRVVAPMAMKAMRAEVAGANQMPAPTEGFTPHEIVVTARVSAMFTMK